MQEVSCSVVLPQLPRILHPPLRHVSAQLCSITVVGLTKTRGEANLLFSWKTNIRSPDVKGGESISMQPSWADDDGLLAMGLERRVALSCIEELQLK